MTCFPLLLYSQDRETSRFADRLEPLAKEYFRTGNYKKALEGYLTLDSIIPGKTHYNYRIGYCYLQSNFKSRAYPYLEFAYKQEDAPANIFWELGRAYHYGHEFEKAMILYESYKKELEFKKEPERYQEKIQQIDRYIQMCRNGLRHIKNPLSNIDVVNLGPNVNSEFSDFSPLITRNEQNIFFTSKRPATEKSKVDPLTDQFYESIFFATKNDDLWGNAESIGPPIHRDNVHNGAVGLAPDGLQLLIYRGDNNSFTAKISGNIYVSNLSGNKWTKPKLIESINSNSWESHASLTEDKEMIVFTSDRSGGMGGTDIYFSTKGPNDQWNSPQNIGGYINTKYDEDGPFIHPDGNKLYFSSKGHDSMGGYDIFFSEYLEDENRWTRPENVGYPINSADDDIFFVWSADGERAYFSSEREDSYGDTDIYMLTRDETNVITTEVRGKIIDKYTREPRKAEIIVRDMLSNNLIGIFDADFDKGTYSIKLKSKRRYFITIKSTGYQDIITELDLREESNQLLEKDFELRKRN